MAFVYLEPSIYVPYELDLRKRDALKLTHFEIQGMPPFDLSELQQRPKRWPNRFTLFMTFDQQKWIDITPLQGTTDGISFLLHWQIQFQEIQVQVRHLSHVGFSETRAKDYPFEHFNLNYSAPAFFGAEGKKHEPHLMNSGLSALRKVVRFGLDGAEHEHRKWVIETLDILYPYEELRHSLGPTH